MFSSLPASPPGARCTHRRLACCLRQAFRRAPRKGSAKKPSAQGKRQFWPTGGSSWILLRSAFRHHPDGEGPRPIVKVAEHGGHRVLVQLWKWPLFKVTLKRGRTLQLAPAEFIALDDPLQRP